MVYSDVEAKTVQLVKHVLDYNKAFYINFHGSMMTGAGLPDIILCYKSRFVGLELKRVGALPKVNQLVEGLNIVDAGGRFMVIYTDFTFEMVADDDWFVDRDRVLYVPKGMDGFSLHDGLSRDMSFASFEILREK